MTQVHSPSGTPGDVAPILAHRTKRLFIATALLLVIIIADVCFVVIPMQTGTFRWATPIDTIGGRLHRNFGRSMLRGIVWGDQNTAQWNWESDERPLPADSEVLAIVMQPRIRETGLITPFVSVWNHSLDLQIPPAYGGMETENRLRREFAERLRADAKLGPTLPAWFIEQIATADGETTRWNWMLLLHDILFLPVIGALGWNTILLAIAGIHWFCTPRHGRCVKCRYDLHGLKADRCPECGTQIERSSQ